MRGYGRTRLGRVASRLTCYPIVCCCFCVVCVGRAYIVVALTKDLCYLLNMAYIAVVGR